MYFCFFTFFKFYCNITSERSVKVLESWVIATQKSSSLNLFLHVASSVKKEDFKVHLLWLFLRPEQWLLHVLICPQGQADLLKHARMEVQENLKQIHYAALTSNLSKGGSVGGSSGSSESRSRRSLEVIPEKATVEEELTDEDG